MNGPPRLTLYLALSRCLRYIYVSALLIFPMSVFNTTAGSKNDLLTNLGRNRQCDQTRIHILRLCCLFPHLRCSDVIWKSFWPGRHVRIQSCQEPARFVARYLIASESLWGQSYINLKSDSVLFELIERFVTESRVIRQSGSYLSWSHFCHFSFQHPCWKDIFNGKPCLTSLTVFPVLHIKAVHCLCDRCKREWLVVTLPELWKKSSLSRTD